MTRPSRGWRESMATMRKNRRCFRPIFFMRMRTATDQALSGQRSRLRAIATVDIRDRAFAGYTISDCESCSPTVKNESPLFLAPLLLFLLLLAVLGALLGTLAVAGADLALEHVRAGQERAHAAQAA